MPLINNKNLPSYERLGSEGQTILESDRALSQEIREIHIGILNIMPDAALEATERQFLRLINSSTLIAQLYVHFFTLPSIERDADAQKHIQNYYEDFDSIKDQGLDALIITGANDELPNLTDQPFWLDLCNVMDWAYDNVTSTMCSCLATHVALSHFKKIKHQPLDEKLSGVYNHEKIDRSHPLLFMVNTLFTVPHSRNFEISAKHLQDAGIKILIASEDAGVHMATSEDGIRFVYFQGHPEYDTHSLLKEYKRDIQSFVSGNRKTYPDMPENYFSPQSVAILEEYRTALVNGETDKPFPEDLISERLINTWRDSCRALMNNWVGHIYQITNVDRKKPFMDGIDPQDPLGIKT